MSYANPLGLKLPIVHRTIVRTGVDQESEAFNEEINRSIMDSLGGIAKHSLTTHPAIGIKAVLQRGDIAEVSLSANLNEEKRLITGVAMIPGQLIIRDKGERGFMFDTYTKSTIYHARNKFHSRGHVHAIDWEHSGPQLQGIHLVESWLVADPIHDKLNAMGFAEQFTARGFEGIPIGTWAITHHVTNDDLWNELKTNPEGYGYSIEGFFAEQEELSIDDMIDHLVAQSVQIMSGE